MNRRSFVNSNDELRVVCAYRYHGSSYRIIYYTYYVHDSVFSRSLYRGTADGARRTHFTHMLYARLQYVLFIVTNVKCRRLCVCVQRLPRLKRRPEIRSKSVAETCRCQTRRLFSNIYALLLLLFLFVIEFVLWYSIRIGILFVIEFNNNNSKNKSGHAWKRQNKDCDQFLQKM